jgi:hypothetical protein
VDAPIPTTGIAVSCVEDELDGEAVMLVIAAFFEAGCSGSGIICTFSAIADARVYHTWQAARGTFGTLVTPSG